jgi:hypothetical protein
MYITVAISYTAESETHKQWVMMLTDRLMREGFIVRTDSALNTDKRNNVPQFMEWLITESLWVLCICSKGYIRRFDGRKWGVGYEGNLLANRIYKGQADRIVPLVHENSGKNLVPKALQSLAYIDFRDDTDFESKFGALVAKIRSRAVGALTRASSAFAQKGLITNALEDLVIRDGTVTMLRSTAIKMAAQSFSLVQDELMVELSGRINARAYSTQR